MAGRVFVWTCIAILGGLFLLMGWTLTLPGYAGTRQGKDMIVRMVVVGLALAGMVYLLLRA